MAVQSNKPQLRSRHQPHGEPLLSRQHQTLASSQPAGLPSAMKASQISSRWCQNGAQVPPPLQRLLLPNLSQAPYHSNRVLPVGTKASS